MDCKVERADDVQLERRREDEDDQGDPLRIVQGERAVRREEHHPGDERAKGCHGETDADSAEESSKQYRRQECHWPEAFAHSAEHPAQERRQDEERASGHEAHEGPVARQLPEPGFQSHGRHPHQISVLQG
jgi:hypothetical protein